MKDLVKVLSDRVEILRLRGGVKLDFKVLKEYNGQGKCHEIQLDYIFTPANRNLMKDLESYSENIEWVANKEPVEAPGPFQYFSRLLYKIGLLYFFKISKKGKN